MDSSTQEARAALGKPMQADTAYPSYIVAGTAEANAASSNPDRAAAGLLQPDGGGLSQSHRGVTTQDSKDRRSDPPRQSSVSPRRGTSSQRQASRDGRSGGVSEGSWDPGGPKKSGTQQSSLRSRVWCVLNRICPPTKARFDWKAWQNSPHKGGRQSSPPKAWQKSPGESQSP